MLREIGGDVFDAAAQRFDDYKGGTVSYVDRSDLDPSGAVLGTVDDDGNVMFANDLLKGDLAINAVHESRHLKGVEGGGWTHSKMPIQAFYDEEYRAYQALPNPGPYLANEHYFQLRNAYPIELIRPLPPRP